jgi:hypothetical protein
LTTTLKFFKDRGSILFSEKEKKFLMEKLHLNKYKCGTLEYHMNKGVLF